MTDAELRNLGLALGLIGGVGAVISKSVAMQIISAAGSAASAFGGWESKGSSPGSHGDHD
ncbi:hypothetical protein ACED66_02440 [Vibrio splendidus]|uniref:hypothetical protein n=2 Tax=Vibrionaceae TaxID=641 RepID=UPI0011B28D29|nr:hypothetical protein [Vibrio splendidus]